MIFTLPKTTRLSKNIAIQVSNLSKKYTIGKDKESSLRGQLATVFRSKKSNTEDFWSLQNLNIIINKGEVIGVIGRNGAGKSTLLKLLSQITKPTTGKIEINGRIASLLEVGTGFHPELTGRENIYLNGTILGMSRKEVKSKFNEIVEFSGVEKFIDTPVKNYSSGMYVRLAFAVAAHLEPEILIIDEVLAVGDAEFQAKCLGKMKDVAVEGRTVIFVSHNLAAVKELCSRGIVIEKGELKFDGPINEAITIYNSRKLNKLQFFDTSFYGNRKRGQHEIYISSIEFDKESYSPSDDVIIKVRLDNESDFNGVIDLSLFFFDDLNNVIFQFSTFFFEKKIHYKKNSTYQFRIPKIGLNSGVYKCTAWVSGNGIEQDYIDDNEMTIEIDPGNIFEIQSKKIVSIVQKEFWFTAISE